MTPKEILNQVRRLITDYASGDRDKWWYANRYVFARLQLDERQTKMAIKHRLLQAAVACSVCGKGFDSRRGVHLHRTAEDRGYSEDDCVLMHAECHRKHHAQGPPKQPRPTGREAVHAKESIRYEDKPFVYWWDIAPNEAERLDQYETIAFLQKDTGRRCVLPVASLRVFLTAERQTTRGAGNWGIKVLRERPDELAFEQPGAGAKDWIFLPVNWVHEHRQK
jgi:5-methylcytosine-specific restriction endonuclease McrA